MQDEMLIKENNKMEYKLIPSFNYKISGNQIKNQFK